MLYTVNRSAKSPKLTPDDFNPLRSGDKAQTLQQQLKEKLERIRREREAAGSQDKPVL